MAINCPINTLKIAPRTESLLVGASDVVFCRDRRDRRLSQRFLVKVNITATRIRSTNMGEYGVTVQITVVFGKVSMTLYAKRIVNGLL